MPHIQVNGANLYYEITGKGIPLLLVHEYAGDYRSWEPQVRFFARRYKVVTFNARGYPPSEVVEDPSKYSQNIARDDIEGVIKALGLAPAHVVAFSMGAYASLHLVLKAPELFRSAALAGLGYGSVSDQREKFQEDVDEVARRFEEEGMDTFGRTYVHGPTRLQFKNKDPRGFAEWEENFVEHSGKGQALTMRGIQRTRPSIFELEEGMKKIDVPMLIMCGDEDDPVIESAVFMKRTIPTAGLTLFPNSGHNINQEEPEMFTDIVHKFIAQADASTWPRRDPRTQGPSALLVEEE
jgi:pimeloyl-ACP methyl ester carboxylesterase